MWLTSSEAGDVEIPSSILPQAQIALVLFCGPLSYSLFPAPYALLSNICIRYQTYFEIPSTAFLPVSQSSSQVACQTRNAELDSLTDLGPNHVPLLPSGQFLVRTVTTLVATAHKELYYLLDGWCSGTSTERADLFEKGSRPISFVPGS